MTRDDASGRITFIALLFVAQGVWAAWLIVWHLLHANVDLRIDVLGIWIGMGLLRRSERARRWANVMLYLDAAVVLVVSGIALALRGPAHVTFWGTSLGDGPAWLLFFLVIPGLALIVWEVRTLRHPDVRAQFQMTEPIPEVPAPS
jgi:hypothetical protein